MPQSMPTKIAGIFRYPEGKEVLKRTMQGDDIALEREPTNTFDSNAVKVIAHDGACRVQLGYLPKELAAQLKDKKILYAKKGAGWDMINIVFE